MHTTQAKGILSAKNYINIYRGCTHGCIYCDGRSKCYDMKHSFEDVEVKLNAPQLLEAALRSKRSRCVIGTGYMSDPYVTYEKELKLTRKCLEIISKYNFGLTLLTKSDLLLRDLDLLKAINKNSTCVVQMTLTAYDDGLSKLIEPNVCTASKRFEVLSKLRDNNIATVVWLTPIIPYITDTAENIEGLLDYCLRAGVRGIISYDIGLTLRDGNREYFYSQLEDKAPEVLKKYLKQYNSSYYCISPKNDILKAKIKKFCTDNKLLLDDAAMKFAYSYVDKQAGEQLSFF